ncbi:glycosyltransferase family 2 protein [Paracraurococcus lichenis]|uniref:Glycosyltransferase family 2 protein n=1 Tax=Paracraurococcus lichenis TaxID=3064888 RepID=A0ABT9E2L1_9PROT|nr:glycosyltransferase family 2 protein [Paracraurococcus sp. LOR1-02]MDO9710388.1 glycosyltransferase family 2 protein [Paracraurococcus sp. LOR1-02]
MPESRRSISVIICAYTLDRWDAIGEAIASLRRQTRVPEEILLVVDHNPELLTRAAEAFPDLRVVANEQQRGLSGGRNTGIALAGGDLLVFFDDDAVAAEDWIERLERRCAEPGVLGATNPVAPQWLGTPPAWFPPEFLWTVGCSFPGAEALGGGEVRNLQGGAMMFHREVFDRIGGFSHQLGRTGANTVLLSCEETELCIRARAAFPDGRFMSDASTRIWHKVSAERMTVRYFCRRTHAEGLSKARVAALSARHGNLATERGYVLGVLSRAVGRDLVRALTRLDRNAAARAGMIILGLACAGAGFIRGRHLWSRSERPAEAAGAAATRTAEG